METRAGAQADGDVVGTPVSPVEMRVALGHALARHRLARGVGRIEAARAVGVPDTAIGAVEGGYQATVGVRLVLALCDLYGVADHDRRIDLMDLARQGSAPGWWAGFDDILPAWFEPYLALEQSADLVRSFDAQYVPGLLQTPEYARAVIQGDEGTRNGDGEHRVALRMLRQRRFLAPDGPRLWALLDESVLRRGIADRKTMFRQLNHLADLCDLPRLRIQVVPLSAGGHSGGPMILLRLPGFPPDGRPKETVYLEQLTTALYIEEPEDVLYYRHVLSSLSTMAYTPADTPDILRRIMRDMKGL
ncbi:helix-turn-helix protein [Actinocorallia herbida]|uniref:Helix-turn-helix protein n=1 Tax=Actinocorallia herbida TaxID=58109 RepID=A0A3N1CSH4_9ACTN|nr:helix-turn-helix transcriptional regulator [Actinocorallia herbida]ROO84276.1 helix-turn-helix protein [Actinocorallia herbida]